MIIREATASDAGAIAVVHVNTWQTAYRGLIPDRVLDGLDVEERAAFWRALLAEPHQTFVAECGSGVVGFCSLIPARNGEAATAEIAAIYVSPLNWRQGVGGGLCSTACNAAAVSGFSSVSLWVLAANHRAISFYQAQSFAPDGATRTEVIAGGPAVQEVHMRRRLDQM